jgi:uncharacterized secreted protein with C-terminal beta-propeller domain
MEGSMATISQGEVEMATLTTRKLLRRTSLFVSAALLGLSGCAGSSGDGSTDDPAGGDPTADALLKTPTEQLALKTSTSCEAVTDYVADSIAGLFLNSGFIGCVDCVRTATGLSLVEVADANVPVPAAATAGDSAGFADVTGTNTQESGVDELDIIEADADGNFYLLDGRHLVVANGTPPEDLRELASMATNTLVAPDIWYEPDVRLLFIDVSDPLSPVITRRLSIDGYRIAARRIDSRVHLVSHFTPVLPAVITDSQELNDLQQQYLDAVAGGTGDRDALEQSIRDTIATLVAATSPADYVPAISQQVGEADPVLLEDPTCADIATPDISMPFALTVVTSVDTDGSNVGRLAIANNAWNVYASEDNLYLMQPSSGWWWDRRQSQQTAIYKVRIGSGLPAFVSLGMVDGWANSSYQFSEHDDYLRVATNRWEIDPSVDRFLQHNNLYVLGDTAGGLMEVVGSVEEFGIGERIFSARFLGDRGYVVTFRQIDPLFAFDLSDPFNPSLEGELEIPGVSTYIHPIESDYLLTIGFDGDDDGLNRRTRLQIFDVQDLADPRLLHSYVPQFDVDGFAWTSALYDPHAFNYFDAAGVLTIPVQYRAARLDDHFSGFVAFKVDTLAGFTELGRLDHSDLARKAYCPDPALGLSVVICDDGHYLESANPSRSVAATWDERTYIYTLSDVGMKASAAQEFSDPVAVLPLPYPNQYWWWITE